MGNSQPKATSKPENEELPKISHERFANRQIIKNGNEEESILIKVVVPHQKEYNLWSEQVNKIGQHEALLLPKSHSFKKEGFCGLSGTVDIIYQNYPFLLSDEIHNRECLGTKFFQENELWYLVLTLLSAAEFFHSQQKKIGDVRPENVFISEDGSVKVACLCSWPLERTNYQKSFEKNITYISPQEVIQMGYAKTDPSCSFDLSETFSIGLTLLDSATLSDSRDLYKGHKSFDYQRLEERLQELQQKQQYGPLLKALIHNMCDVTPDHRTNCRQLFDWLSPYEEQINNFQEFQATELPEKVKVQYQKHLSQQHYNPPINPNNNFNSYNTYIPPATNQSYQSGSPSPYTSYPPPQAKVEFQPQQQVKAQYNSYISPVRTTVPTNNPGVIQPTGGIGFTFQSNPNTGPTYVTNPRVISSTVPPQRVGSYQQQAIISNQPIVSNPAPVVVQSAYIPYNSKFSLEKIDEQLEQSRKMFPS